MRSVDPGSGFESWRVAAKRLLAENVDPAQVLWEKETDAGLFGPNTVAETGAAYGTNVPADFVELARSVSCHCDPSRWALLYRILWRIVKDGERRLCMIASDPDIAKALRMQKNVRREIHKMHAFVRFRLMETDEMTGRETYAAWIEPEHHVVEASAPFFRNRFANMDWSIFTPKGCAHWDGSKLSFTPGIEKSPIGNEDALELAWKTYYRSIFNPARVKVKMMQTEMPKKYWKNLPEAELIGELIEESRQRVQGMHEEQPRLVKPVARNAYLGELKAMSNVVPCTGPSGEQTLEQLAKAAESCRGCPLWKDATNVVFGEGPENARIMIVGEQPGDKEDIAGKAFIGPAGRLLDEALEEAGIDRSTVYVTNAVKHFKWKPKDTPRGKIRLHQSPGKGEIDACRPWVLAELQRIAPDILILLGGTAARSLLEREVKITKERGLIDAGSLAKRVLLTVHPSYLLRVPGSERKSAERQLFINDLKLVVPR